MILLVYSERYHSVPPPFNRREDPNFEDFKKGETEQKLEVMETKKGGKFKMKGGARLFKLNLGTKKGKNGDFQRQISIKFLKNLPAAAKDPSSLDIYCEYNT